MNNPYQTPAAAVAGYSSGAMIDCVGCAKPIHISAAYCPGCGASQRKRSYKNKTTAAVLAFLLGGLGIHRFYLGQWWGIFYLLLCWTGIPGLIAFVEFIVFLLTDHKNWDDKYNEGKPAGLSDRSSASTVLLIVVGVFGFIAMIGILAAIAIPAYQDYTMRVKVSQALTDVEAVKARVNGFIMANQRMPENNQELELDQPYLLPSNHMVYIQDNQIVLQLQDSSRLINGETIVLKAEINAGNLSWSCKGGSVKAIYRPAICR